MAYKSREDLLKELSRLRTNNENKKRQLKAKKETLEEFKKMNNERRNLKREIFELKHGKKIKVAKAVSKGATSFGREVGKGLVAFHKYQQTKKKTTKKRK